MKNHLPFKSIAGSVILAALMIMVSCSQFETAEPALENSQTVNALGEQVNASILPNSRISTGNVEPVIIPGENAGGNRTCDEVAAYFGSPGFDFTSGKIDYNGGFSEAFPEGFTIETDGTNVSWSFIPPPGFCLESIAFIVKGGNDANVYNYGPDIYEDSGLTSPENASGGPAGLSNLTICYTLRACVQECYQEETAWASGDRYVTKGNWATYVQYSEQVKIVKLLAGQTYDIGNVTLSPSGGNVEIKIELNDVGMFQDVASNVKIQGYSSTPPATNPAPGQFNTHKGTATGSTYTVIVPKFAYYGIHVDAGRAILCETE